MRLQELKTKETVRSEEATGKRVQVFLQSSFYTLDGNWLWEMETNAVFCSDVMFSLQSQFEGTKAIFHPDDLPCLKEKLFSGQEIEFLEFRIITTYGEVKTLSGENIRISEEVPDNWQQQAMQSAIKERLHQKELTHLRLLKETTDKTGRISGTGTWYYNASTLQTWYADSIFQMHGLPPQSLNPHLHTFLAFVHPEDKDFVQEFTDKAFQERAPLHMDYRIVVNDNIKWVSYKSQWFYTEEGEAILCGTMQDMTEQKLAEREIETYKNLVQLQRQQLLFDEQQINFGHWQLNLLTRKTTYSDQYYRIFGLKPHAIAPTIAAFLNYVHPDDREKVEVAFKQIIHEHALPELEYRIIRGDGKTRYVLQKAKILTSDNELIASGIIQDVTVQRLLERKVAELNDSLQQKNWLAQQSDKQASLITWTMDLEEGNIAWSESFYALAGFSKVQPVNLTEKTLFSFVHPYDLKLFKKHWEFAVKFKQASNFAFRFLHRGAVRHMQAFFHHYQQAEKDYFIGTVRDITAEQVLQQQLSQRVQLAESLSENTLDRVLITDSNNTILFWNHAGENFYGIKKGDAIGQNFFDVFPQLKTEEQLQLFQQVLRGERVVEEGKASTAGKGYYNLYLMPLYNSEEISGILHVVHDVTKETELRNSLHGRLQLIEGLVQSSVDRIIALDRNMNYLYWNKSAEDYYSIRKEEVLGKNILEVFPRLINDPSYGEIRKALRGETIHIPVNPETEAYFETYLIPIKDEKGQVTSLLWMAHDLRKEWQLQKEQRKAQEQLQEEHDRLKEAQAIGHVGSFQWDAASNKSYWSDEMYRIHGLEPQGEVVTLDKALSFIHPDDIQSTAEQLKRSRAEAVSFTLYHRIIKADGETRVVKRQIQSFANEEGVVTHLSGTVQDITEQHKTEEQLKEHSHYMRRITETVPDMISVMELPSRKIHFLNNEVFVANGFDPAVMAKKSREELIGVIHPDDRKTLNAYYEKLGTASDEETITAEYRARNNAGEWGWFHVRGKVFQRDAAGKVTQILNAIENITERKKSEQQLQTTKELFQTVFDASLQAIILFKAIRNNEGEITDYEVVLNNAVTQKWNGRSLVGKRCGEAFPHIRQCGIFDMYKTVLETSEPQKIEVLYEGDELKNWFSISAVKLNENELLATAENITEEKIVEEELRHNKVFIEEITHTTPDLITIHDAANNHIIYANQEDFWKGFYNLDEVYNMKDAERAAAMIHPDDLEKAKTFVEERRLLREDEVKEVELKTKADKWIKIRSKIFKRDEQGKPFQIISFTSDITEAKKAELEAQKNLTILQHAEAMALMGSWEYQIATEQFNWSEGMYNLFGLPQKKKMQAEIYLDFAVEEDRPVAKRIVNNLKKKHQSFEEVLRIKKEKDVRLLKIKAAVVYDEKGKAQKIIGADLDITDIKEAERKVEESQRLLQQTALASPDAITIYDLQKKQPVYLNNCLAEWIGTTPDALLQMGIEGRLQIIHPDDRLRLLHFNEKVAAAKDGDILTIEYRIKTSNDRTIWIRNRGKVFQRDAAGKVTHILSVLQDVTEENEADVKLKELNASLEKKAKELESKNEEVTSFAFVASHDLKEPLRKIHTFSDWLLSKETSLTETGKTNLEKMTSAVKRLDLLINDILALTNIHARNEKVKEVDLNELLKKIKDEMQEKIERTGAIIEASSLPTITGAENQLFYLFKNIISNGIKFQLQGNQPKIKIKAERENGNNKISFTDNGIGIAPEYHKKIFEIFRRLHGRSEYEGTGMGLTICKRIMEKHGGKITVESDEGNGATFTCWFPI